MYLPTQKVFRIGKLENFIKITKIYKNSFIYTIFLHRTRIQFLNLFINYMYIVVVVKCKHKQQKKSAQRGSSVKETYYMLLHLADAPMWIVGKHVSLFLTRHCMQVSFLCLHYHQARGNFLTVLTHSTFCFTYSIHPTLLVFLIAEFRFRLRHHT